MKKFTLTIICITSLMMLFYGCSNRNSQKKPKYIFYMIGDGMGFAQTQLAENYLDAVCHDTATTHLEMMKFPVLGTATTYSASSFVTCSSAAGTALATGYKTKNSLLGVLADSVTPITPISQKFHDEGYNVGIITSVTLDHATPAAFYAHVKDRNMYKEISYQLKDNDFEFFGGAGLRGLKDDIGLYDSLKANGFVVTCDKQTILDHKMSDGKLIAYNPVTNALPPDIPYLVDSRNHDMHLPFYVKKAIDLFEKDKKKGFFMMIEGGRIDHASHANDPGGTLGEMIDFDEAIKLAYEFYTRHPKETLIVITADHETGGLSIGQASTGYASYPELLDYQKISYDKLKAQFKEMANNDVKPTKEEIYNILCENFGFNNENPKMALNRLDSLRIDFFYIHDFDPGRMPKYGEMIKPEIYRTNLVSVHNMAGLAVRIMSEKAGIGWTTGSHTGGAVPVRAIGVWQEKFDGYYDNTDIPKKIHGDL